jgi:hypothetical protein
MLRYVGTAWGLLLLSVTLAWGQATQVISDHSAFLESGFVSNACVHNHYVNANSRSPRDKIS